MGGGCLGLEPGPRNTSAVLAGGGFHHCSSDRGGGFCAYADITLAIKVCPRACGGGSPPRASLESPNLVCSPRIVEKAAEAQKGRELARVPQPGWDPNPDMTLAFSCCLRWSRGDSLQQWQGTGGEQFPCQY